MTLSPEQYRAKRLALGLTQQGLAERLGLPRTAVTKRESGEQRITEEAARAINSLSKTKRRPRTSNND